MSTPVSLLCTVRGCGLPLALGPAVARCGAGHAFDRARSGYWNLLQPQDRRSARPGDSGEIAAARRRLFARGASAGLFAALRDQLAVFPSTREGAAFPSTRESAAFPSTRESAAFPSTRQSASSHDTPAGAVLDVGCGEGSLLDALASALGWEAHGVDLSAPAIDLAARSFSGPTWVVANADRGLPYATGAFDAVLSITARRPGAELHRVLRRDGLLLVALPADDDLAELRSHLHGEAPALGGAAGAIEELAPWFAPESDSVVRHRLLADRATAADLLLATYRGQRASQAAARAEIPALAVTLAQRLQTFRPRH